MSTKRPSNAESDAAVSCLYHALIGKTFGIKREEFCWLFRFDNGACISSESVWRLRNDAGLLVTNIDDGQQFGLPEPVDAEAKGNGLIASAKVISIKIDAAVADLSLVLDNGVQIDFLTNSSGYESWQMAWNAGLVIGRGEGLAFSSQSQ
jgi:hypothetical protein